jgi:hypothetical protein
MWKCPHCGSTVDDSFDVCWSCGTTPDGVLDPEFTHADESEPIADPVIDPDAVLDDSLEDFGGVPIPELAECYMAENTMEAKFIADRLMEQGIPAVADTHDMNAMLGGLKPSIWGYGPKVRVLPKDLIPAQAWVASYLEQRKDRQDKDDA